jgi:rRNA maturation endonuclease Nob1
MIVHDDYNITNFAMKLNAKILELEREIAEDIKTIQSLLK